MKKRRKHKKTGSPEWNDQKKTIMFFICFGALGAGLLAGIVTYFISRP